MSIIFIIWNILTQLPTSYTGTGNLQHYLLLGVFFDDL